MHFRASGINCILDDVQRYCNPVKQNTTISPSMTPLPTPAPAIQPSSGTSSPRIAPIVGGSIAGMAFLLAIVIWLAVRRRVRRPHRVQDSDQSASDAHLTPFTQQLGHLPSAPKGSNLSYPLESRWTARFLLKSTQWQDPELWTELDRLANVGLLTLSQPERSTFGGDLREPGAWSGTMTTHHPVFQLLAQHSHRWRSANFTFSMANIDFSCLKGKLPLLRRLRIITLTMHPHTVDFFVGASQLKSLTFSAAALDTISTIVPIPQLTEFGCWGVTPDTAARALSLASKLPWDCASVPHSLLSQCAPHRQPPHTRTGADPSSVCAAYTRTSRDHGGEHGDSGADSSDFLITDNVLRALTFPARRLIPRLRHFACGSHWQQQCACNVFVDFVKSRLEESASSVFRVEIWSPPDGDETLSCAASFHARLQDLAADSKGTLLYDLTARVV
ncbi:hypothetical protein B0H13DRAFT_2524899 [Mycena leptocephala]|nr:hypothetical protein B0H13DRAFT_2524899 [Mycena leptocephala]